MGGCSWDALVSNSQELNCSKLEELREQNRVYPRGGDLFN